MHTANKIDKVIDNLYIGNYDGALDKNIILSHGIKTIVNCTKRKDKINMNVNYLQIPIDDPPYMNDINYVNKNFVDIVNFISNARNYGNVLVHCVAGSQRSATIVAIFLMVKFKLNYKDAIQFMKSKRPICFFGNVNYMDSLIHTQNMLDSYNRYYQ